ncbi:A disintegrin and metalloproteinase with thrombospondin motifs like [Oratosquilla oratoria]|uniref:A disintegrin and metalloproteinase with thrombospondin motifs like n=1 Tax=Oratosquilla oratoria TaxID=337810 RepID=UPI003F7710C7
MGPLGDSLCLYSGGGDVCVDFGRGMGDRYGKGHKDEGDEAAHGRGYKAEGFHVQNRQPKSSNMNGNTAFSFHLMVLCGLAAVAPGTTTTLRHSPPPIIDRSKAKVTVAQTNSSEKPFHVQIEAFDTIYQLKLTPVPGIVSQDFKLHTTLRDEQGQLIFIESIPESQDDELSIYHDSDIGAAVTVRGARVEGILSPFLSLHVKDDTHEVVRRSALQDRSLYKDYLDVPQGILQNVTYSETRDPVSFTVEIYVLVDSELANLLGSDRKVKHYLSIFWNSVRQRYSTLSDPQVQLILSGALIIRDRKDEPFITSSLTNGYPNGPKTLNALSEWLFKYRHRLPGHDVAYLMTGRDVVDEEYGKIRTGLSGIAWKGAACAVNQPQRKSYNAGLGEDIGAYYGGVLTATHEVAHSLGSPHDGQSEASGCPWTDGYIMSYVTGSRNKLHFSPCSAAAMKAFSGMNGASCLKKLSPGKGISLSSQLPGHIYSLDKQCQRATGEPRAFASKAESDDSLCVELKCQWVDRGNFYHQTTTKTTGHPAAQGSPCRGGGRCINGRCQ